MHTVGFVIRIFQFVEKTRTTVLYTYLHTFYMNRDFSAGKVMKK